MIRRTSSSRTSLVGLVGLLLELVSLVGLVVAGALCGLKLADAAAAFAREFVVSGWREVAPDGALASELGGGRLLVRRVDRTLESLVAALPVDGRGGGRGSCVLAVSVAMFLQTERSRGRDPELRPRGDRIPSAHLDTRRRVECSVCLLART